MNLQESQKIRKNIENLKESLKIPKKCKKNKQP